MGPLLLVGLDRAEVDELRRRLEGPILAYDALPRIRVDRGTLLVEHPNLLDHFVPVERVVYHAIFEDDHDFLAALALWNGPCLPAARGMMDLRLRLPGLVRALAVTSFGGIARGFADRGTRVETETGSVAKWGNWHCGEDKARFDESWVAEVPTLFEEFIEGEAVRIVLIGDNGWQVRMAGEGWLKSIHAQGAGFMPIDPELFGDAVQLALHFGLATIGVDYIVASDGSSYLLEVNHIPNVTVFPEFREASLDLVVAWAAGPSSP